ncbi:TPA: hypothetical protein ACHHZH_003063, partial [Legionella pneumophila]
MEHNAPWTADSSFLAGRYQSELMSRQRWAAQLPGLPVQAASRTIALVLPTPSSGLVAPAIS